MKHFLGILIVCLLPLSALAQNERAPEVPKLSVEVITAGGATGAVYVQQQVLLKVTLISRYPFKTLQIETPKIADVETHVASRARTREFSTYGGSGWRHERVSALFPLRSGSWTIPAITATGSVAGPDGATLGFEATSEARLLDIQPAHPYLNGFWWIAANEVSLSEEWSADIASVRIGDTVRRTIRMTATGTTADRLPELTQNIAPGAIFADVGGERRTRFTPEGAIAEVSRSWDITVNSDNPVNIPPVSVTWWHTGESRPAGSGVPAARIEPLAVDADQLRAELLAEATASKDTSTLMLLILAALIAAPALAIALAFLLASLPTRTDLRLRKSLRHGAVGQQPEAVIRWGKNTIAPEVSTLRALASIAPPKAATVLQNLEGAVYGRAEAPTPDPLAFIQWSRNQRMGRIRSRITGWIMGIAH